MHRRQLADGSSTDGNDPSDIESCFDQNEESNAESDLTADTDVEPNSDADVLWLLEDKGRRPKYYLDQDEDTSNTFPIPENIYNPSLVRSPHIFLLGLILADGVFAAPDLMSAEQFSGLDIQPGTIQLPLLLIPSMNNISKFRKSTNTTYGTAISPDLPLPNTTLLL